MEEDLYHGSSSPGALTKRMEKIEDKLKKAMEVASERMKYETAHNEDFLGALRLVEAFIQRKKRVCYGGTAMNMILPAAKRFYNPDLDLPDYDFYTPDLEKDVEELVRDLKEAGYKDVYHRVGIHEGTKKILVNFVAVADVSEIEPELFAVLYRRSIQKDGIHYTDPDILRMMMYLELSRPRGQVERWEKVFERLQLINHEFPVEGAKNCKGDGGHEAAFIPMEIRSVVLNYIIEQQRILCNGPMLSLYRRGIFKGNAQFLLKPGGPLMFTSPDPKSDAITLKKLLHRKDMRLFLHKARGEIVPERFELRFGNRTACLIVKESACHSYNNVPLEDGRILYIGSPEFLITLYLSLAIFTSHSREVLGDRPMCLVKGLVDLAMANYSAKRSQFPAFALSCRGHQTGYASLLRAKVERIQREKQAKGSPGASLTGLRGSTKKRHRVAVKLRASSLRKKKET
jgi:hypothetical protein